MFKKLWAKASAIMDEGVDTILGDTIAYALDGVTFKDVQGFVIPVASGEESLEGLDETLGARRRVKISVVAIGAPERRHRLKHPQLGPGLWRPAGGIPAEQGRYVLFDVQKASQ